MFKVLVGHKQQAANQENAQRSTGPKTEEGKEKVRFNAVKHGLRSQYVILPSDDPAEYEVLYSKLRAEWNPQAPTEEQFVEQMAVAQWRISRADRFVQHQFTHPDPSSMIKSVTFAYAVIRQFERSFDQAIRGLLHLRKQRKALDTRPPKQQQRNEAKAQASTNHPVQQPIEHPMPAYVMSAEPESPVAAVAAASGAL